MFAVGIDLGTTGCKAVIADQKGNILGQDYIEYPLIVRSSGVVEQDANVWWQLTCKAVATALLNSRISAAEIKGISVCSQGISFVLTDEWLNPIGNAISWLDIRAKEEVSEIKEKYSEEKIYKITGKRISESYVLPKILWLKKHCGENFGRTHKILMAHDFLIAKMTGNCCTDHTMAGGTMLYDISNRCWSHEILNSFDIRVELLPEIRDSGTSVGTLTEEATNKMGLMQDTLVAVGGQDQKVAAFYAQPDLKTATLCLGTAGAMEFLCSEPVFDEKMRIPVFSFLTEHCWTLEAVISAAGAALKWLKNTLFQDLSYSQLDSLAEKSQAGSGGLYFYPHFGGATSPYWNSCAKGVFYGLTLNSRPEDIIRSVLEAIAFQIKTNLLVCEELFFMKEKIIVFGSGGKSSVWCQIIADIIGKKVISLSTTDSSGLGAAKLAFLANERDLGYFGYEELKRCRSFIPAIRDVTAYEKIYQEYLEIEKRMLSH